MKSIGSFIKKYINVFLGIIIVLLCIGIYFIRKNTYLEYTSNLYYMNTYIQIRLFSNQEQKAKEALKGVEEIFKVYHDLSNKYEKKDNNLYTLNEGKQDDFLLDSRLYDLLEYGIQWYEKSNGLFNINMGCVTDIWKNYREKESGVPTQEELFACDISIDNIKLSDHKLMNQGQNIDLGGISKGYTTSIAADYLKEKGITRFIINAGGNVVVGDHYNQGKYQIGIENPNLDGSLLTVVNANNISVVTSGSYERYYEYDGVRYHHLIDPKTRMPANYMKGVTVLSKDAKMADALSTILFLMPIEEGMKYLEKIEGVEAIWCGMDGTLYRSKGFFQYES